MTRTTLVFLSLPLSVGLPATRVAQGTYSVVAADKRTGQVGGAVASCVGSQSLSSVFGAVPGRGAVAAQAYSSEAGRREATRLMRGAVTAAETIRRITSPDFDFVPQYRQFGAVDLNGGAAAFTGTGTGSHASHKQGTSDDIVYSIQGNLLTGPNVISQAQKGVETATACDFAERLMLALEEGRKNNQGDKRCVADPKKKTAADSAFLRVDQPDGATLVQLTVVGTGAKDAVIELRSAFNTWRAKNACKPRPALMCGPSR